MSTFGSSFGRKVRDSHGISDLFSDILTVRFLSKMGNMAPVQLFHFEYSYPRLASACIICWSADLNVGLIVHGPV